MACGCVPVGTRTAGIPTLIDDTGFYVEVGDVEATANAIRAAYASPRGNIARDRILERFSHERRRRNLQELVEGVVLQVRSEEHTSELQSHSDLVCRLLLEKKK